MNVTFYVFIYLYVTHFISMLLSDDVLQSASGHFSIGPRRLATASYDFSLHSSQAPKRLLGKLHLLFRKVICFLFYFCYLPFAALYPLFFCFFFFCFFCLRSNVLRSPNLSISCKAPYFTVRCISRNKYMSCYEQFLRGALIS